MPASHWKFTQQSSPRSGGKHFKRPLKTGKDADSTRGEAESLRLRSHTAGREKRRGCRGFFFFFFSRKVVRDLFWGVESVEAPVEPPVLWPPPSLRGQRQETQPDRPHRSPSGKPGVGGVAGHPPPPFSPSGAGRYRLQTAVCRSDG